MDYLQPILKLGLPLFLMSWWAYSWLYRNKLIDVHANSKQAQADLKAFQKATKEARKAKKSTIDAPNLTAQEAPVEDNIWVQKWLSMGGGFYGLATLWTLIVIEILELVGILSDLPAFLARFSSGWIDLLVAFFVNQMQNLVTAFVWFNYWDNGFSWRWVVIAYAGYWLGMQLAKRKDIKDLA